MWTLLKNAIASVIKPNDNQEITGQVLQSTLNSIVNAVGENATFAGVATPATAPGEPDGPVFYLAATPGNYVSFGSISLTDGEIAALHNTNNGWVKSTITKTGVDTINAVISRQGDSLVMGRGAITISATAISGEDPNETCTLRVDIGGYLINTRVKSNYISPQTLVFEKAPYTYGGLFCIFDKSNNKIKELRVGALTGANSGVVVGIEEYAELILSWNREAIRYSISSYEDLSQKIAEASFSITGPCLYNFGKSKSTATFKDKKGEGDKATCTLEFTNPIILCAISKNYIPSGTAVFEDAPLSYGCLIAIYSKIGVRPYLRMEVTATGASPSSIFKVSETEIAVPIMAWVNGVIVYSYQDNKVLSEKVDSLIGNKAPLSILPPAIYTVCNDINWKRNYSLKLYIDHLIANVDTRPNVRFSNNATHKTIYSKYNNYSDYINSTIPETTEDVSVTAISDTLTNGEVFSTLHRSVRNKATSAKNIRLLCIGDSVTEGTGANKNMPYNKSPKQYWSWVKALFEMDAIEAGQGYSFETLGNLLGTSESGYTFDITDLNGLNKKGVKAYACGVGASKTSDWLSATLNNGAINPFYDIAKQKFSLRYWVEKYRTLIVNSDGSITRCNSENKGLLAPLNTELNNVCEPTHVLIQLGYNQPYSTENNTRAKYLNDLRTIIETIREEYPDVYVLLSLPDTAGTFYPEEFKDYIGEGNDIYNLDFMEGSARTYHNSFAFMNKDLIALADETNKVFYVPTYFASPLVYGASVREISETAYLASKHNGNKAFAHEGALPYVHPNCAAHANWAYQIYSLLKYTALIS